MIQMKSVREIPVFKNIPILVRAALNAPVANGVVVGESFRLQRAVPTLRFLQERGARIIAISHIDPPGTTEVGMTAATLEPVAKKLGELLPQVSFFPETIGPTVRERIRQMAPGDILVLENLRRNRGEVMNDPAFARELAALADVFVEDSFDTCHRVHASIVGVPPLLPSYAGLTLLEEVAALTAALKPKSPSLAVIGGAKFSTKEAVIETLLEHYTHVFIGGALANDFLKASGHPVGKSLVSLAGQAGADPEEIKKLLGNPKLILPIDWVTKDDSILDGGAGTSAILADLAQKSKSILWNGPLGNYENGFTAATDSFARAVASSRAHSVVGGGDTIASIQSLNLLSQFSFVSTGGGAMLEFLAKGNLPGIKVLS